MNWTKLKDLTPLILMNSKAGFARQVFVVALYASLVGALSGHILAVMTL